MIKRGLRGVRDVYKLLVSFRQRARDKLRGLERVGGGRGYGEARVWIFLEGDTGLRVLSGYGGVVGVMSGRASFDREGLGSSFLIDVFQRFVQVTREGFCFILGVCVRGRFRRLGVLGGRFRGWAVFWLKGQVRSVLVVVKSVCVRFLVGCSQEVLRSGQELRCVGRISRLRFIGFEVFREVLREVRFLVVRFVFFFIWFLLINLFRRRCIDWVVYFGFLYR